jgi:hypothetical protein
VGGLTPATNAADRIRHRLPEILPRIFRYAVLSEPGSAALAQGLMAARGQLHVPSGKRSPWRSLGRPNDVLGQSLLSPAIEAPGEAGSTG